MSTNNIEVRRIISWIDRNFYEKYENNWDDSLLRDRIVALLSPDSVVLDLGAGAGIVRQMDFRGLAVRICGVDLDPRVETNPFLDEGQVADGQSIPYPDATFDLVFADNVLEHLDRPETVFAEVLRVLKPGGVFLFKTPNKWHYMPLISRLTPHSFHQGVNRKRGGQRRTRSPPSTASTVEVLSGAWRRWQVSRLRLLNSSKAAPSICAFIP